MVLSKIIKEWWHKLPQDEKLDCWGLGVLAIFIILVYCWILLTL